MLGVSSADATSHHVMCAPLQVRPLDFESSVTFSLLILENRLRAKYRDPSSPDTEFPWRRSFRELEAVASRPPKLCLWEAPPWILALRPGRVVLASWGCGMEVPTLPLGPRSRKAPPFPRVVVSLQNGSSELPGWSNHGSDEMRTFGYSSGNGSGTTSPGCVS